MIRASTRSAASRDDISFTPSLDITRTLDAGEDNARLASTSTLRQ